MDFLITLTLIILLTKLFSHIFAKFNLPTVIGELLVGIIFGPALLNLIHTDNFVTLFAQIGVILLMFIAGIEGDLTQLMKYWKPSLVVAIMGVIFPTIGAFIVCVLMFHFQISTALFIGLILSATSVSISIQVLKEMNYLDSKEGMVILGAAVADDIICVILLGIASSVFAGPHSNSLNLIGLILPKLLFFVLAFVFGKWLVPPILSLSKHLIATENLSGIAIVLCLAFASLATYLGMSDVLGAYFIGLAISQTKYKAELSAKIEAIGYSTFIPVFFVSIGLNVKLAHLSTNLPFILITIIIALIGKQLGGWLGARLCGFSSESGNIIGAGMVSRGEMALVVAQVSINAHLIDQSHYTAMIIVTVVTTLIAPLLLKIFILKQHAQEPIPQVIAH
ncbi:cation:proton antiporter [Latilactobacillus fuchuensis]|uniref:Cation/H+ exchanger transmembrane domain-containing protein n=1 Tax=Latilactobacillus fuchuensis DSM 14340 = JCM 11249 TaxID=1423747 RepID=A0A0R1RUP4_9LACO|nr:cation:proton antiporter [Latilactobacillus fuchuensis]KRL60844.1 hypothetical protein FC69_GL001280 [Latilactobacillus fuchuensis DSM 14340 = JCM 11249]